MLATGFCHFDAAVLRLNNSARFLLVLLALLTLASPVTVNAQTDLRFSVVPGDDSGLSGIGSTETEFRFSVAAANAYCYQVNFGDGESTPRLPPAADGRSVLTHTYARARRYQAALRVWWPRSGEENLPVNCADDLGEFAEPILLTLGIIVRPPRVTPAPPPPVALFSVAQSSEGDLLNSAIEPTWADFTFSAYVMGATRYELNYGDGVVERNLRDGPAGEGVIRHHRYAQPGTYTAVLTATRLSGGAVELTRQVNAIAPAASQSAQATQWPVAGQRTVTNTSPPEVDYLPWLLLFAAVIASLRFAGSAPAQADAINFAGTRDSGHAEVKSGGTASEAMTLRTKTAKPTFVISADATAVRDQSRSKLGDS